MDFNLAGAGINANIEAQVDPTHQAVRTSSRPLEWQAQNGVIGGHYAVSAPSGAIAAGGVTSAQQIFQVRWGDSAKLFLLKKLRITTAVSTAFAAGVTNLEAFVGHNSSANGSGGTQIAPTSTSNRLRSTMSPSAFVSSGEIRVATTAGLTAATGQVLEAAGIGITMMGAIAVNTTYLFEQRDHGTHPLILSSGDTLIIRASTIAGTGVWTFGVDMEWVETSTY